MGLGRRDAQHHLGHPAALDESYWTFRPGARVMTVEGYLGTVTAIEEGFAGGGEFYTVLLDAGMGGGSYSASEITDPEKHFAAAEAAAAGLHVASEDYPELEAILIDRPPIERQASFEVVDDAGQVVGGPFPTSDEARPLLGPGTHLVPHTDQQEYAGWGTGNDASTESFATGALTEDVVVTPVMIHQKAAGWGQDIADGINKHLPADVRYNPHGNYSYDWCRYRKKEHCFYPKELDYAATKAEGYQVWIPYDRGLCSRADWDEQKVCPLAAPGPNSGEAIALIDATVPYSEGGQRGGVPEKLAHGSLSGDSLSEGYHGLVCPACQGNGVGGPFSLPQKGGSCGKCEGDGNVDARKLAAQFGLPEPDDIDAAILLTAAASPSFHMHITASWKDIQAKAKRIRSEGGVRIISSSGQYLTAEVKGDSNVYQTTLVRVPGRKALATWECGCPWATYSWARSGRWKKYEGRQCSHALALSYEASAQEWMGGTVTEQPSTPPWAVSPVLPGAREKIGPWMNGPAQRQSSLRPPATAALAPSLIDAMRAGKIAGATPKAKVRGRVVELVSLLPNQKVLIEGDQVVPASEVLHPLFDPSKGLRVGGSKLAATSFNHIGATWRDDAVTTKAKAEFTALSDSAEVIVYHGTTPERAASIVSSGTVAVPSDYRSDLPTHAADAMYVAPTYADAEAYSKGAVVALQVRKGDLQPSPEARSGDLTKALFLSFDGAILPAGHRFQSAHMVTGSKTADYQPGGALFGSDTPQNKPDLFTDEEIRSEVEYLQFLNTTKGHDDDRSEMIADLNRFIVERSTGMFASKTAAPFSAETWDPASLFWVDDTDNLTDWHDELHDLSQEAPEGGWGIWHPNHGGDVPDPFAHVNGGGGMWPTDIFSDPDTTATLNDEPEPALPRTDGASEDDDYDNPVVGSRRTAGDGYTEPGTKAYDAHTELNNAVRDGKKSKPSTCSKCRKGGEIIGHHSNYDQPLNVTWLCKSCHGKEHAKSSSLQDGLEWLQGGGPATDQVNAEIADGARQFLAKTSGRVFSPAEQRMFIDEGSDGVTAANLGDLDIEGTHYLQLEEALSAQEGTLW